MSTIKSTSTPGNLSVLQISLPPAAQQRAMHAGYANEASPGQPGAPTGVQHIVVNVPIERTNDYLVWSLCTFVYANFCCLGLGALICSVRARDRKALGDQNGAQRHASSARIFNIVALTLTSLTLFTYFVVLIAEAARR